MLRFPQFRRAAMTALVFGAVAGIGLLCYGGYCAYRTAVPGASEPSSLGAMVVSLAAGVTLIGLSIGFWCLIELSAKAESHAYRSHDVLLDIKAAMDAQTRYLHTVADSVQLSDAARSIAHREREQEVLRQAINEDILREDWEAAYYLVDQLELRFGYKLEAERLRNEIESSRTTLIERKIQESCQKIRELIASREWERAQRGLSHLLKHHHDHAAVKELPAEIEARWSEHKRRLLKEWDQAVARSDVDESIRILRELDQYLTPEEAQGIKEAARDIFKAKLNNLQVQFTLAVTEQQWGRALEIGNQIVAEFPNSRMANEVRDKHEALRARAERARVADAAASS